MPEPCVAMGLGSSLSGRKPLNRAIRPYDALGGEDASVIVRNDERPGGECRRLGVQR